MALLSLKASVKIQRDKLKVKHKIKFLFAVLTFFCMHKKVIKSRFLEMTHCTLFNIIHVRSCLVISFMCILYFLSNI